MVTLHVIAIIVNDSLRRETFFRSITWQIRFAKIIPEIVLNSALKNIAKKKLYLVHSKNEEKSFNLTEIKLSWCNRIIWN